MSIQNRATGKLLGDAGEHYALSQLTFAGQYSAKMPDNWEAYDLAVESGTGLLRMSVKTRSESKGWTKSKWFTFDDRKDCDWMIFIFRTGSGELRSWVIPYPVAKANANRPGPERKEPWMREVSWTKLISPSLSKYENNWALSFAPELQPGSQGGLKSEVQRPPA